MLTVFERSVSGRSAAVCPNTKVPAYRLDEGFKLTSQEQLPQLSEIELVRHYTQLSQHAFGVDNGFYPLGSCTMKYNPKLNEVTASLPGFTGTHPLAPVTAVQGCLELQYKLAQSLAAITGMDAFTLQPAAGAHGEYTGLLLIRKYHEMRGDTARTKIIVPDSAHGTNPASAAMAGFEIINVPSNAEGGVDLDALAAVCNETVAGLMLTNPNTLGRFDKNIMEISRLVHEAGGLVYYDGANLNAIMGIVRPGDMGFDLVHLNLHKTFSTPHGGGGPGSGPVGCKQFLADYLPSPTVVKKEYGYALATPAESIGKVKAFYGNFAVMVKAYTYILTLGREGIPDAAKKAVLNANYLKALLSNVDWAPQFSCMHEFVLSLETLKKETGVSALDVAKALIDCGIHPPTMYFPLIVHEALMFEPTETETPETLENAAAALLALFKQAKEQPETLHQSPLSAYVSRPDEVLAARQGKLKT